jgi:UDP-N-acetylmuramate--alanine ligase
VSERVHFIGVGGSGMSAVARLTAATGVQVSGSDVRESPYFVALREAGMDVHVGHNAALVDGAAAVVVSTAVRDTNPELVRARERGIAVWHRSEALARALAGQRLVAVAGSHGKTTTSAMVAHVLHACGIDASYAVGARVLGIEGAVAGGYAGSAGVAVIEADESDGSFLRYDADIAILTNVEADHLDHYGTEQALTDAFMAFACRPRVLIACSDDPAVMRIAREAERAGVEVITYGASTTADVVATATGFTASGVDYQVDLPMPGAHNRLNAAAAWAAACALQAPAAQAAASLATFGGTGRRYEPRGEAHGVRVVDDYAHHPTEVAAVLRAAREAGEGHLVVLFQPMLFTRTKLHAQSFADALSVGDADIVLTAVHGDREDPIDGVDSQGLARRMSLPPGSTVRVVDDLREAAQACAALARPGDLVLTLGSGTVTVAPDWILEDLQALNGDDD